MKILRYDFIHTEVSVSEKGMIGIHINILPTA
jgi:hypothetical protein